MDASTQPTEPSPPTAPPVSDWFLSARERGNPATRIDRRREDGSPFSSGNRLTPLVHGAEYFPALRTAIERQRAGDLLLFTDWRGDPDERMGPPLHEGDEPPTTAELFAEAARRGVIVKGLFWRSHWDRLSYSTEENRSFADDVRAAGGEVLLDMRIRPLGSHHQKFVVLRHPGRPELDVAFVGGIDLCHTRNDTAAHHGDPQAVRMGSVWGPTPAWHDAHVKVQGPAVGDVEFTFRERWNDPTPLLLNPAYQVDAWLHRDEEHPQPMPDQLPDPEPLGQANVQVLRTYPAKRPRYPFAPLGERSVARGYDKAVSRGHSLIYIEDQYFWSGEVVSCFAKALRANPRLHLIVVLAHYASQGGKLSSAANLVSRSEAIADVTAAGGDRVGIYGLENHAGTPVYVHAKICVVDDVWATIGSDNVNRRSWTHDSELTCAIIDEELDRREPPAIDGFGHGARSFARSLRLKLAAEHLDRDPTDAQAMADLLDPTSAFEAFRRQALDLQAWHDGGRVGPRPPGRLRPYLPPTYHGPTKWAAEAVYRFACDPDGRPWRLRLRRPQRF